MPPEGPIGPEPEGPIDPGYGTVRDPEEEGVVKKTDKKERIDNHVLCPETGDDLDKVRLDNRYEHCFEDTQPSAYENMPSITEGREFDDGRLWNTWFDTRITRRTNSSYSDDIDTNSSIVAFGIDKKVDKDKVIGVIANVYESETDGLYGALSLDSNGFNIGSYLAWRLGQEWTAEILAMYGWFDNKVKVLTFDGEYDSEKLTSMISVNGQFFTEDEIRIRPKFSLANTRTSNDSYMLNGSLGSIINPILKATIARSTTFKASSEFSKTYVNDNGLAIIPWIEAGVSYQVEQWGNLDIDDPWSGEILIGITRQIDRNSSLKANMSYTSIGQKDIDDWGLGLFYSYSF